MVDFASSMLRSGGLTAMYAGLGATVAKHAAHSCFYFAAFHEVRKHTPRATSSRVRQVCVDLSAGFVAGCAAATANNPFDVVKTRQQVASASSLPSHIAAKEFAESKRSLLGWAIELVRRDGLRAFYKGYFAKVARLGPGSAIIFCIYEQVFALI